jgi:predicted methyltransferase
VRTHILLVASLIAFAGCKSKDAPPASSAGPTAAGSGAAPAAGSAARPDGTSGTAPFGITVYTPAKDVPGPILGAIADDDRTDKDRALDAGRKPGEVLAFFQIAPGQRVGELFAGGGYTTELLARVVGDSGKVWAQNTKDVMDRFARGPITERLARLTLKNIVMVEQPAETPFPADARNLDAVICVLNYHDFVWQKVDRAKLNAAVFAALKPGGVYGIVDHSAAAGSGLRDVEKLHRIDEAAVKQEIIAAGFKLDGASDVLRNPADPRDWNSSPKAATEAGKRGTSDRFVLRFKKP